MAAEADDRDGAAFDAAIPSSALPLPRNAHIPGTGTEPDWQRLMAAKSMVPEITKVAEWRDNTPYIYGFALMRGGFYWEAHELWEPVWMNCPPNSRERSLLRALIQTANAKLKIAMGRQHAAERLMAEALRDLVEVGDVATLMGVEVARMRQALASMGLQPQRQSRDIPDG